MAGVASCSGLEPSSDLTEEDGEKIKVSVERKGEKCDIKVQNCFSNILSMTRPGSPRIMGKKSCPLKVWIKMQVMH